MTLTNIHDIPLPLAVWLAYSDYDFHKGDRKAISATSLLKSTRQIILTERLTEDTREPIDVTDLVASRLGQSIHAGVEKAWLGNLRSSLGSLGYPKKAIDKFVINPEAKEKLEGKIPVYIEQRTEKKFKDYIISGKFDMILDGQLNDFKSTSVYSLIYGDKDEDYILQASIYRWLNPELITNEEFVINFIFTDWSRAEAARNSNYPQHGVHPHKLKLMSIPEITAWLRDKFKALEEAAELDEPDLPFCTDKELWRSPTVYKYYSDPEKAKNPKNRSTRNFDSMSEAQAFLNEKGKGAVVTVPGKAKACSYCPALPICFSQGQTYDLT